MKRKNSVTVFSLDGIGVDPDRDRKCGIELAATALSSMNADAFGVGNDLRSARGRGLSSENNGPHLRGKTRG
jgi:hypothetical protein